MAGRSANAAKETTELLGETINSMEEGVTAADDCIFQNIIDFLNKCR